MTAATITTASHESILHLQGVTTRFGNTTVHENLDLEIYRGEIIGVIGGSGAGKSVLLRTILGLNPLIDGSISMFGKNINKVTQAERRKIEQRWGVLFQDGALFSSMTVLQNVEAPLKEHTQLSHPLLRELAMLKIHLAGLPAEAADKLPSELSGGMRKRASLARALALDPDILFLDEPTAGLDPITAAAFDELIRTLRDALNLTVYIVTHDLDTLHAICDRVAVLAEKRIYAIGSIRELTAIAHPWIEEYFSGPRGRVAKQSHKTGEH